MSALPEKSHYTEEEYLLLEHAAEYKSFYFNGLIYAMAGASPNHTAIEDNVGFHFSGAARRKGCTGRGSNQRLLAEKSGKLYNYPDYLIVCGKPEYSSKDPWSILNPTLIVEVLSPRTEDFDKGSKAEAYRAIPSLQTYILIDSTKVAVMVYQRQSVNQWVLTEYSTLEDAFEVLGETITLADLYENVDFSLPAEEQVQKRPRPIKRKK